MPTGKKHITMASVSAKAKVSQMTVSLALRNHPSIPTSTRTRIRRIAEQLGYRPDPVVGQLMTRLRSSKIRNKETIAWICAHEDPDVWKKNLTLLAFHKGVQKQADALGYQLDNFHLHDPEMSGKRLSHILKTRAIKGIIIPPLPIVGQPVLLDWERVVAVTCGGFSLPSTTFHRACPNYTMIGRMGLRKLLDHGYRRIGFILYEELHKRTDGLLWAGHCIEQQTIPPSQRIPPIIAKTPLDKAIWKWYLKYRPDAVIAAAEVSHEILVSNGVRIPEECGLSIVQVYDHRFSGTDERREDVGMAAMDLMAEQLHNNQYGIPKKPKTVLVNCGWYEGPTTPGPKNKIKS